MSSSWPRHGRLIPAPLTALLLAAAGGGLALLGAIGPQAAQPGQPTALKANAAVAPAPLDATREERTERATRSRRAATPDPEPVPVVTKPAAVPVQPKPAAPLVPGCDGRTHDINSYANGRLPDTVLCALPGGGGERLQADAALGLVRLAAAYLKAWGEPICLTDGYRTLGEQRQLRRTKPRFAARPGSSEHGWGRAVDVSCGVQSFRTERHAWMVENASTYGWFLPDWARRGGSRPEPWHWEYSGA